MDDLNDQIPRLRAFIKILEKERQTKNVKEELDFQKNRLDKMIKLVKDK